MNLEQLPIENHLQLEFQGVDRMIFGPIYDKEALTELIRKSGVILTDDHFVLTSGWHTQTYFNKRLLPQIEEGWQKLTKPLADYCWGGAEVLIGLDGWGKILAEHIQTQINSPPHPRQLPLLITTKTWIGSQELSAEQIQQIQGKKIAIIDDVVTTGLSIKSVLSSIDELVTGSRVCVVFTRCQPSRLSFYNSLINVLDQTDFPDIDWTTYEPDRCPLCQAGRPINQLIGHGENFPK